MFKRLNLLFPERSLHTDRRIDIAIRLALRKGMRIPDTEHAIAAVADVHDLHKKVIEGEIIQREEIRPLLEPLLKRWREIAVSLEDARKQREKECPTPDPPVVEIVTVTAIYVTVLASLLCSFFISPNFLLGLGLAAIIYEPLRRHLNRIERLEHYFSIPTLEREDEIAANRVRSAAENLAPVAIWKVIGERLASFSTAFRLIDHRGLRSLTDPGREVPTAASEELSTLMASLSSGSIGLSGPRGAGKTTLIDSFARGRSVPLERSRIGLVVSAPVKYDAKEFVLHLFAALCECVIGAGQPRHLQSEDRIFPRDRRRAQLAGLFGVATLLVVAAGGAMLIFDKTAPEGPQETGYTLLAIGGVMAFVTAGLIDITLKSVFNWDLFGLGTLYQRLSKLPKRRDSEGDQDVPLAPQRRSAKGLLEQIRFQQSISSSVSGAARLPLGISVGGESGMTMTRTPWSLPEAVQEFRQYAASLTEDNYLVIGIDELDKMGSDDTAREFLNNVKGVFGVSGCYYLVSISDDAMASFERRGMPVRDVFDSSFDAVQPIAYLTLKESRAMLDRRAVGLPIPYQCLCHCMAGGLPRDLIRVTRELVHQATKNDFASLDELTHAVVEAELRTKLAGAIEASRETTGVDNERVQEWLDQNLTVADPRILEDKVLGTGGDLKTIQGVDLAFEVATFNYFAATVLELFRDSPEFVWFLQRGPESNEISPEAIAVLENLAKARQQFSIGPGLAWKRIAEVRAALSLADWDNPREPKEMSFGKETDQAIKS